MPSRTPALHFPTVFPILVAITSDAAAEAAVKMAHTLAEESGAIPTVLRVVREDVGVGVGATGTMCSPGEAALIPEYQEAPLAALEAQVQDALGTMPPWRYEVEGGVTVPTIAHRVEQLGAELVILGLPPHNFLQRAFIRDTVQGVVEQTTAAVLALRPTLTRRPNCILVAVDFSPASLRAAHFALHLLAPGGRLILVYVHPDVSRDETAALATEMSAERGVDAALAALVDDLAPKRTITVTSVIEYGNSIAGVKTVALRMQPDLVALGSGHHSAVDWFFGDSVSTAMINERRWSLLVVPG